MTPESSKRATYVNEGIVVRTTVHVRIACICGAAEFDLTLISRVTCPHCRRTYGVRALSYAARPTAVEPLHVSVGYYVAPEAFQSMTPVGRPA